MESFRFLCCGKSFENLNTCLKENVIGYKTLINLDRNERIFIVYKYNNEWMICASGVVEDKIEYNPFTEGIYKSVYKIGSVTYTVPFSINEKSRELLGTYWGLNFQSPKMIKSKDYIEYISNNYNEISLETLMEIISHD